MAYIINVKLEWDGQLNYKSDSPLSYKTLVVVEGELGKELGQVMQCKESTDESTLSALNPIIRVATTEDIFRWEELIEEGVKAKREIKQIVKEQDLHMNLFRCYYSLDKDKLLVSYTSEQKVDFRSLLLILREKYQTKIDFKQLRNREKAKKVGGVGICGLPLCCQGFLNVFDGIGINLAKNQNLALNIDKLTGQCGKYMCCLKYEDEVYTQFKSEFPAVDDVIQKGNKSYRVTFVNFFLDKIILESKEGETLELNNNQYQKLKLDKYYKIETTKSTDDIQIGIKEQELDLSDKVLNQTQERSKPAFSDRKEFNKFNNKNNKNNRFDRNNQNNYNNSFNKNNRKDINENTFVQDSNGFKKPSFTPAENNNNDSNKQFRNKNNRYRNKNRNKFYQKNNKNNEEN